MARKKSRADGRFEKTVFVGKDDEGRRKYVHVYGTSFKEATDAANELKQRLRQGLNPDLRSSTFYDFAEKYKRKKTAQGVGASWLRTIQNCIDKLEPLHKIPIEKITATDVQDILDSLAIWQNGRAPLARKTIANVHAAASAIFEIAIPDAVQYNPASKCYIPKGAGKRNREIVPSYQVAWLNETPHRAQRAAMIACYGGLRRGEIAALTWADVNLSEEPTIRVNKSYDYSVSPAVLKSTKTEAGDRLVSIPLLLSDYLKQEKACDATALYIMRAENGKPLTESAWKRLWQSYMNVLNEKYGHPGESRFANNKKVQAENGIQPRGALPMVIRKFGLHDLRHTFCSMLYMAGVPILVAKEQMGHSKITTTLEIYTHFDKQFKKYSMQKFNEYLHGDSESQNASNLKES